MCHVTAVINSEDGEWQYNKMANEMCLSLLYISIQKVLAKTKTD